MVKYFIWFCIYVCFVEIIGAYNVYINKFEQLNFLSGFLSGTLFVNNKWWYLLFWNLLGSLFYAFYFNKLMSNTLQKRIIKYLSIVFVLIYMYFFINKINEIPSSSNTIFNILNAILIITVVLMYLIEVLKSDKVLSIFHSMSFYIGATILLWNLIMVPLTFYDIYFNRSDMEYSILKAFIFLGCNTFMYLTFSFALIWCKPQNN